MRRRLGAGIWQAWTDPGFALAWTLAAFALLAALVMATQHCGQVQGRWHAWLEDDAMVSMQYARHLAGGQGLVWTPGERVEGFSNPLWTLLMAAVLRAGVPRALASAPMLAANLVLGLAAILAVARLARALGAGPLASALAAAGFGLSFELVWAAASGMESVAMACATAWACVGLAEARARRRSPPAWVPALAGALTLLRFDGLLPAACILALAWMPEAEAPAPGAGGLVGAVPGGGAGRDAFAARPRPELWRDLALALGPVLAWQAFRLGYYGAWVPNTVLLKSGAWAGRWQAGWLYLLRIDWESRLALFAALAALALRPLRPWALAFVLLLGYALATGGDLYPGTRYLAPAWPLLWALAAASLARLLPAKAAAAGMALAALFSYHALWAFGGLMQGGREAALQRVEIAEGLDAHLRPGDRVASAWAGSFYFYSDAAGVDLLGKCDPVVARSAPDPAEPSAHNKLLLAESLGRRRPEWVLLVPPFSPLPDAWLHAPWDRKVWNDPLFAAHCRGQALAVGGPWALCRCDWAALPLPPERKP